MQWGEGKKAHDAPTPVTIPGLVSKSAGTPKEKLKAREVPTSITSPLTTDIKGKTEDAQELTTLSVTTDTSPATTGGYLLEQIITLTRVVPDYAMARGEIRAVNGPTYYPQLPVR